MKFKSKIDIWCHISFSLMIGLMVLITFYANSESNTNIIPWIVSIILILVNAAITIPTWVNTCYILGRSSLIIKSGFSKPFEIPYADITSIHRTKGSFKLAQSALSLDRLEIIFKNGIMVDYVFVSPVNKEEFYYQLSQKTFSDVVSENPDRRFV